MGLIHIDYNNTHERSLKDYFNNILIQVDKTASTRQICFVARTEGVALCTYSGQKNLTSTKL